MMNNLPKIDVPIYETTLPSSGEKVRYRPYTAREEDILMMAAESKNSKDISNAIKQVLNNCVISDKQISFAYVDFEWLFLKLRECSVSDIIDLEFESKCEKEGCQNRLHARLDLKKAVVGVFKEDENGAIKIEEWKTPTSTVRGKKATPGKKLMISETVGIVLTPPSIDIMDAVMDAVAEEKNEELSVEEAQKRLMASRNQKRDMIYDCVHSIFDESQVYVKEKDFDREHFFEKFYNSLPKNITSDIEAFIEESPTIVATIPAVCKRCNRKEERHLSGLADFFV